MFMIPLLYRRTADTPVILTENTALLPQPAPALLRQLRELIGPASEECVECEAVHLHSSLGEARALIEENGGIYRENPEGYCVSIGREIHIWAENQGGMYFAVSTLRQLRDAGELTPAFIYDYPRSSLRGYRAFIPGRDQIGQFKKMIDLMVYYKYNVLMLEIGGAMEYKRHPEINEKWEEYCRYLAEFPNKCS